jgi:hypothetical protein
MDALAPEALRALMEQCGPPLQSLYEGGAVRMDAGVGASAKTLRQVGGALRIEDAPALSGDLMVGNAFVIEAADEAEALKVASQHPAAQVAAGEAFGWRIELRPILHYAEPGQL